MKKELPNINHKTVVFTKHARERMALRKLSEDMIIQVMRKTNKTYNAGDGKTKFIGKSMGAKVHVICKPIPEENKWLVITLWVRGENDAGKFTRRKSYRPRRKGSYTKGSKGISLVIMLIAWYYFTQMQ